MHLKCRYCYYNVKIIGELCRPWSEDPTKCCWCKNPMTVDPLTCDICWLEFAFMKERDHVKVIRIDPDTDTKLYPSIELKKLGSLSQAQKNTNVERVKITHDDDVADAVREGFLSGIFKKKINLDDDREITNKGGKCFFFMKMMSWLFGLLVVSICGSLSLDEIKYLIKLNKNSSVDTVYNESKRRLEFVTQPLLTNIDDITCAFWLSDAKGQEMPKWLFRVNESWGLHGAWFEHYKPGFNPNVWDSGHYHVDNCMSIENFTTAMNNSYSKLHFFDASPKTNHTCCRLQWHEYYKHACLRGYSYDEWYNKLTLCYAYFTFHNYPCKAYQCRYDRINECNVYEQCMITNKTDIVTVGCKPNVPRCGYTNGGV